MDLTEILKNVPIGTKLWSRGDAKDKLRNRGL